ncbi:large ATP-binding protein [Corynebacterium suranareeae]|uniref:Large ATP-binding protein n=1 Tax=Corynebacterium suranareeae TaxID=2506452 RepID=A0A160PR26_9CORY|nr:hypothetical protein [Corynebacterium suranareeae]BAU95965.1 large ATP-binding protein [Corynebacterium suranareeae]
MSIFSQAIIDRMSQSRRGSDRNVLASEIDSWTVDRILRENQVTTAVRVPTPSQLQATRLSFYGSKTLTGVDSSGVKQVPDYVEEVPYQFEWALKSGLNGVGSDRNLRGKSTVLRILMWCLRGRCDLQPDVLSWIDHVEFDFLIDSDTYRIEFDVCHTNKNQPVGQLIRRKGIVENHLGSFESNEQFEELMGATMLHALGLPKIASQTEGLRVEHVWPTYAGALVIRGDGLEYLLGDVPFAGLPSRLLSIFVGTEWASVRAEASTAKNIAKHRLAELERAAKEHSRALSDAYTTALTNMEKARQEFEAFEISEESFEDLNEARSEIARLDAEAMRLTQVQFDAKSAFRLAEANLKEEETRRHQQLEDAVARRFFQNLRPTVCPRCSIPVPDDRLEAEAHGDSCSICSSSLELDDLSNAEANKIDGHDLSTLNDDEIGNDNTDYEVEELAALREVLQTNKQRLEGSTEELKKVTVQRERYSTIIEANLRYVRKLDERNQALLTLARAEGAVEALKPKEGQAGPDTAEIDRLKDHLVVLSTAEEVVTKWVREEQNVRFQKLNSSIVALARDFGIPSLTQIQLSGNAGMTVEKGGAKGTYSKLERGEKLRLKLATAIALIKLARAEGIGLHPGFLIVDSPGAEEVNDDDFDTMLQALRDEAESADIQVFIGTCHTEQLIALLGEERCRIGEGENFVW